MKAACLILFMFMNPVWSTTVVYVDDDAPLGGDGQSWETAFCFLQDALRVAQAGDHIRVAQGVYRPDQGQFLTSGDRIETFQIRSNMDLTGGYAGTAAPDPNVRDVQLHPTVLSGDLAGNDLLDDTREPWLFRDDLQDNATTVLAIRDANTVIDGFSVVGGSYAIVGRGGGDVWGGSGMAISAANVEIVNCLFARNVTLTTSGGAIFVAPECRIRIRDSLFEANHARGRGGALYNSGGYVNLARCTCVENRSLSSGGAIRSEGGRITSVSCEFIRNSSASRYPGINGFGGAVSGDQDAVLSFQNSLFTGNTAGLLGGAISGSNLELTNSTIVGNRASTSSAIFVDLRPANLFNCIVWANRASDPPNPGMPKWLGTCYYCCLDHQQDASLMIGNIHEDPAFALPGYWDANGTLDDPNDDFWVDGNYHLKSQSGRWDPASETWVQDSVTSPCIDAGDPNSPIMHEPFPNGGVINMGAYGGTAEASKSYFGEPPCETIVAGDINGDCRVDFEDLKILMRHWVE